MEDALHPLRRLSDAITMHERLMYAIKHLLTYLLTY